MFIFEALLTKSPKTQSNILFIHNTLRFFIITTITYSSRLYIFRFCEFYYTKRQLLIRVVFYFFSIYIILFWCKNPKILTAREKVGFLIGKMLLCFFIFFYYFIKRVFP
jgi:hypothetical protein